MNWELLRHHNVARNRLHYSGNLERLTLQDWALCIAGEVGEAINAWKKAYLLSQPFLVGAFRAELADVVLYYDLYLAKQDRTMNFLGPSLPPPASEDQFKNLCRILHGNADRLLDGALCSLGLVPTCFALGLTATHVWNKFNEVSTRVGYPQVIP